MSSINLPLTEKKMGLDNRAIQVPDRLWIPILSYLPFSGQIRFDRTNRAHHAAASEEAWRQRRLAEGYSFEWKMAGKSQRDNYCLSKALTLFVERFPACKSSPSTAHNTYEKYAGLAEKFPLFDSFIQWHLLPGMSLVHPKFDEKRGEMMHAGLKGYGGESLLHALFEIGKSPNFATDSPRTSAWLKRSIRQGATFAASLARNPYIGYANPDDRFSMELALEAIEMGDAIPLENLVAKLTPKELYDCAKAYFLKKEFSRADRILTRSLRGYGDNPPVELFVTAAMVKNSLEQYKEADEFCTKFIAGYGNKIPLNCLMLVALVKLNLEQHEEVNAIYAQILADYGESTPATVIEMAADAKERLEPYEEADIQDEEKQNVHSESISSPVPFHLLPDELWGSIFSYLPFTAQIGLEKTNKAYVTAFENVWSGRRIAETYTFNWKMAGSSQKVNYCLSKTLTSFIEKLPACKNSPSTAIDTYESYIGLMDKFPLLGSYVQWHLFPIISPTISIDKSVEKDMETLKQAEGYGGESLLHALFQLGKYPNFAADNVRTSEWLKQSIRQGATLAASLAIHPHIGYADPDHLFSMELALEAAEMGDSIPFENLVAKLTPAQLFFELGIIYIFKNEFSKADRIFTRGLRDYTDNHPAVFINAALVKNNLHQYEEANQFCARAIGVSGNNLSLQLLENTAFAKLGLEQFKEADAYYTRVLAAYGENPPGAIIANAAFAKLNLGQYKEADELYMKAIAAYKEKPLPAYDWLGAAIAKCALGQYTVAKEYNQKAAEAYGANPPEDLLKNIEEVKKHL